MSQSLSQASLPVFEINLNALSAILDKAEAFAAAKKIEPTVLLRWRLAPDMFDLTRQIQVATDQARRGVARLAGAEAPKVEDNETTFAQLKERIAKTVDYVKTLDKKAIDASADREITFPLGPDKKGHMKGDDYLNHFVLPNFYFHYHRRLRDPAPVRRRYRQARFLRRHPATDELNKPAVRSRQAERRSRGLAGSDTTATSTVMPR